MPEQDRWYLELRNVLWNWTPLTIRDCLEKNSTTDDELAQWYHEGRSPHEVGEIIFDRTEQQDDTF